jgi:hypothetical protein
MGDKSPHDTHTKKSGKSIKEKRAERKAKAAVTTTSTPVENLTHGKKR